MCKILIVESEENVISTITTLVNEKIKEATVVACARNCKDAIYEVINREPDIILTAIRIDGGNGLDMIKKIRKINCNTHIIIISSYDYFEFAKEAMNLMVNDYILKPINPTLLVNSIKNEMEKIKLEREKQTQLMKSEHLLLDSKRFVEYSFMYSILYNGNYHEDSKQYMQLLGVSNTGYIMSIRFVQHMIPGNIDQNKMMQRIHRMIKETIYEKTPCAVGPKMMNHIMVYVSHPSGKDNKEEQQDMITLAKRVIKIIKDTLNVELAIGIGNIKVIDRIHESAEEALNAQRYRETSSVIHVKEIKEFRYRVNRTYDYTEMSTHLVESIKYGGQEAAAVLSDILESLRGSTSKERLNVLIEVLMFVGYECAKGGQLQTGFVDYVEEYKEMVECSIVEQEKWAQRRLQFILKLIGQTKTDRKGVMINAAMQYVETHYSKDITLNEIAEYVNLSPQHFSKIFKEETGSNYVEWVTNVRLTKARDLMNNTDRTIKEICYMVGYQDPNYFSRIFKKYMGVSPTEYMKQAEE